MVMVKKMYLHMSVVMLLTAVLWLAVTIYNSLTSASETKVDNETRAAIKPTIDMTTLENLTARENLRELTLQDKTSSSSAATINELTVTTIESEIATDSSEALAP